MTEPKNHRNPVTAFFRGLYAELAFSGESLRINGVGLLFGLVTGLVVGVCGGVFGPACWMWPPTCATGPPGPCTCCRWRA